MNRVSIKSFPDYKYLLQENYCTWNTNIFIYGTVNMYRVSINFFPDYRHLLQEN